MSHTIHIYEPQSTPRQATIVIEDGQPLAVYVLSDNLAEDARELRSTIVRKVQQNPPPNSVLLFELDVRTARKGELPTMRVLKVGSQAVIELIRKDSRGRIVRGTDLKSGARFEATLRDLRTVVFSLEIESEGALGLGGVAGARKGGSKPVGGVFNVMFLVPNVVETIKEPLSKFAAVLQALGKKFGLSRQMISMSVVMSGFILGAGFFAYKQYSQKQGLEEELEFALLAKEDAVAAKNIAIGAEQICREQRKELTKQLDEVEAARRLHAENAMSTLLSQAVAREAGGARMTSDEALTFDGPAVKEVHEIVVAQMGVQREPLNLATICMSHENTLGQDLPPYMLAYHPIEGELCPDQFNVVEAGVDMGGPWGVSKRVAKEFGARVDVADGEDVRLNDRWSADTFTTALRVVVDAIATADTRDRPPTAPGQLHGWSLAFFDAYNRMPSPAEGAMDRPAEECIAEAVKEISGKYVPAEPGQPVLPPLGLVVSGEQIKVTPTAGCPWPQDALAHGATASVRAITQMALIEQAIEEGGSDDEEG